MEQLNVYLLSLGCAKNLVDSEIISNSLQGRGYTVIDDPRAAQVIIINTCGFIEAAKQESIAAILDLAEWKQSGGCRLLLAVGCMTEKYGQEMLDAMPELDNVFGSKDYIGIAAWVDSLLGREAAVAKPADYQLRRLAPGCGSAYLKIAEGCDNCCSYCLIPQLRGPYISRPAEDILAEAQLLVEQGAEELVLIAQDTTRYGIDIYHEPRLPQLLERLSTLPVRMIRLLYAYPDMISDELVRVMAAHENICHYLDMPIQHGSDKVLRAMNRNSNAAEISDAIARLRTAMPDIALRTTVMVGFPGESEADFAQLLDLLERERFQWVGCFAYSQEEDTVAAAMPGQIEEELKQQRLDQVMQLTARITREQLSERVGQELVVVAEAAAPELGDDVYQGRGWMNAPEVDGAIYFHSETPPQLGRLYKLRLVSSEIYDLWGELQ